jgi:hypothetical protein
MTTVGREEPLRLGGRLEPLHVSLASPRRPVRILGTIVEVAVLVVPYLGQDRSSGCAVTLQPVCDQTSRLVLQPSQQMLEEAFGCRGVPPILHKDVEDDAVLVDGPPEISAARH